MRKVFILTFIVMTYIFGCSSTDTSKTLEISKELVGELDQNNIQQLLVDAKYEQLEAIAEKCRKNNVELKSGTWALEKFYAGLVPLTSVSTENEYSDLISRLNDWKSKMPDAATPRVALVDTYIEYAKKARGSRWAKDVTEEAWEQFRERIKTAVAEFSNEIIFSDPHAYYETIVLIKFAGGPDAKTKAFHWFKKGLEIDDYYFPLYSEMAYMLTERWYGNPGEWLEFAKEYSDKLGGVRGKTIYVHILWYMQSRYSPFDFFSKYNISWPELKSTLDEIIDKNPDNDMNLNIYCYLASIALDYDTAKGLFKDISDNKRYVEHAWRDNYSYYHSVIFSKNYAVVTVDLTSMWSPGQDLAVTKMALSQPNNSWVQLYTENFFGNYSNGYIINFLDAKKHRMVLALPDHPGIDRGAQRIMLEFKNEQTGKQHTRFFNIEL